VFGRQLSRSRPAREALFASLMRSMFLNGKIVTTRAKAKSIQGEMERLVTIAKKGDLSGRRRVMAVLDNQMDALDALYQRVVPALVKRTSGYSRLISLPSRKGDRAAMVRMEWTEVLPEVKKEEKKVKVKKEKKEVKKEVKSEKKETKKEVKK
jgi:large subunit ribosomal protein L17